MIREFEASEFIAMIALNEEEKGKKELRISIDDLFQEARDIEQKRSDVRINLSSNSLQSFFCRVPQYIYMEHKNIIITDISHESQFLQNYASKTTFVELKS